MPNRLADSTSPYLLQHKDNPVEWWPWGDEPFEEARRRDVPVLLSVGYAACHWCHVMAHESFEDAQVAAQMNADFVCVKVDREEHPDVDAVYMEATQALSGHGGWPMTCFLTPDAEPFFCGTYFPPHPVQGMPSFTQVLAAISSAWRDRREELTASAAQIVRQLAEQSVLPPERTPPDAGLLATAAAAVRADYDAQHGGFGGAPKFPPASLLEFLLRHGSADAMDMVAGTCEAMARGGIYDQLAGGFARYSVDAGWVVPHFEKMLYDNAQLARVYAHWWRATGSDLARRIAIETAEFMVADLRTEQGGFASSLDADTRGVEGATYVWTPAQLREVLGEADGDWAAELLSVTAAGTFEHGSSVLQRRRDPDDEARWARVRDRLRHARAARAQPGRDDKIVAAWNGLAIAALADVGALLDRPDLVDAAAAAADLVLDVHLVDGRLRRVSRAGVVGRPDGVLEDYADLAEGLLALAQVRGSADLLAAAGGLLDVVLTQFSDGAGGFHDTAHDAPSLVRRPRSITDDATPAGQSAAAAALLSYAALTGSTRHREAAAEALGLTRMVATRFPRSAGWGLATAAALLAGPAEIAVVGDAPELLRTARMTTSPGAVVATDRAGVWAPLLAERDTIDGRPAAYVCRGFVCQRPVTTTDDLAEALAAPTANSA